jgi:hypothetical protein
MRLEGWLRVYALLPSFETLRVGGAGSPYGSALVEDEVFDGFSGASASVSRCFIVSRMKQTMAQRKSSLIHHQPDSSPPGVAHNGESMELSVIAGGDEPLGFLLGSRHFPSWPDVFRRSPARLRDCSHGFSCGGLPKIDCQHVALAREAGPPGP